ncbi:MAG: hypothetical protein ACR2FG_10785 [Marmoricola sp.]
MTDEPIDHAHRRPADRAALQAQAEYAVSQRPALRVTDPDDLVIEIVPPEPAP